MKKFSKFRSTILDTLFWISNNRFEISDLEIPKVNMIHCSMEDTFFLKKATFYLLIIIGNNNFKNS